MTRRKAPTPVAATDPASDQWPAQVLAGLSLDGSRRLLAVDPGEVHVGVAVFVETSDGWRCTATVELNPFGWVRLYDAILASALRPHYLVIEDFRLYGHLAMTQVGSSMATSQLIGWTSYATLLFNDSLADRLLFNDSLAEDQPTAVVLQGAQIKKPTQAVLRAHRIRSTAKAARAGGHAFDAELHGWFYILGALEGDPR